MYENGIGGYAPSTLSYDEIVPEPAMYPRRDMMPWLKRGERACRERLAARAQWFDREPPREERARLVVQGVCVCWRPGVPA